MDISNVVMADGIPTPTRDMDRLALIFHKQRVIMDGCHSIEKASGLMQTEDIPVDPHSQAGQARLRYFAWCMTEELTEASEAHSLTPTKPERLWEEISDALHFLAEFSILADLTPDMLATLLLGVDSFDEDRLRLMYEMLVPEKPREWGRGLSPSGICNLMYPVISDLGRACNCLKNKPWKQTHVATDVPRFHGLVASTWGRFITLAWNCGLGWDELFRVYWKKSEVNLFRQSSGY